jgi:hypothetical protein
MTGPLAALVARHEDQVQGQRVAALREAHHGGGGATEMETHLTRKVDLLRLA